MSVVYLTLWPDSLRSLASSRRLVELVKARDDWSGMHVRDTGRMAQRVGRVALRRARRADLDAGAAILKAGRI